MVTLFMASLFGLFLFSYLYLVRNQNSTVMRSQSWNAAFGMAEAGVEEALAQLNPGAPLPTIDRTANGWGAASGGLYGPMSRDLSVGSYKVVYTTETLPTIYCTGYVRIPSLSATLMRTVRVNTTNVPLFTVAMAARGNINMSGNGVATDSYNSSLASLSTGGQYDSSKTSTNGDVASLSGIVDVGNANINGTVYLGPTATDQIKNNGTVTGGTENDFNFNFPDVVLPQTIWQPAVPVPRVIDGVLYNYVFDGLTGNGDFTIPNLTGNVYVGTNTHVRLKLTGTASPTNVRVAGMGANAGSLLIYDDGPSFTLSGNSVVDGGIPENLSFFGTTNNTTINLSGNATFKGTIYAPEANFSLGGGGNNTYDVMGAIVANTVTLNGHFNFHFDEALLSTGPLRGYAANSWTEM